MIEIFTKNKFVLVVNRRNLKWVLGNQQLKEIALNLNKNEILSKQEKVLSCYLNNPEVKENTQWKIKKVDSLSLLPTLKCNLSCLHCFYNSSIEKTKEWNKEILNAVIDLLKNLNLTKGITITGGEPFVYKNIFTLIDAVLKLSNAKLLIMSNGIFIPFKEISDWYKQYPGRFSFQISIDGLTNSTYELIRGVKIDKVIKNIEKLIKIGLKPDLSFTLMLLNSKDFFNFIKFAEEKKCRMHFPYLENIGRTQTHNLALPKNFVNLMSFLIYYKFHINKIPITFIDSIVGSIKNKLLKTHCRAAYSQLSIFPNGNIYPCSELQDADFKIINILDFNDIGLLEKILTRFRKNKNIDVNISNFLCAKCVFAYLCAGECRAETILKTGNFLAPQHESRCKNMKKIYELILWEIALSKTGKCPDTKFLYSEEAQSLINEFQNVQK